MSTQKRWLSLDDKTDMMMLVSQQDRQLALYRELAEKNAAKMRVLRRMVRQLQCDALSGELYQDAIDDLAKVVER